MSISSGKRKRTNGDEQVTNGGEDRLCRPLLCDVPTSVPCRVAFSSDFSTSLKLIEVPLDIVHSIENTADEAQSHIRLVGEPQREAVLCSRSKTFSIKRVETSNCVFLVPPADADSGGTNFSITALCKDYYELKPIQPKLDNLRSLLERGIPSQSNLGLKPVPAIHTTEGREQNEQEQNDVSSTLVSALPRGLVSRDQLLQVVQASEAELDLALSELGVVTMEDGTLCILSEEGLWEASKLVLEALVEHSQQLQWEASGEDVMLEEGRCKDVLPELDLAVLRQVLGRLGRMVVQREQLDDRSDSSSGEQCWVLSSLQLQRSTARMIMQEYAARENKFEWSVTQLTEELVLRLPCSSSLTSTDPTSYLPLLPQILSGIAVSLPTSSCSGGSGDSTNKDNGSIPSGRYRYFPVEQFSSPNAVGDSHEKPAICQSQCREGSTQVDVAARLQALYALKPNYAAAELEPYLKGLYPFSHSEEPHPSSGGGVGLLSEERKKALVEFLLCYTNPIQPDSTDSQQTCVMFALKQ